MKVNYTQISVTDRHRRIFHNRFTDRAYLARSWRWGFVVRMGHHAAGVDLVDHLAALRPKD